MNSRILPAAIVALCFAPPALAVDDPALRGVKLLRLGQANKALPLLQKAVAEAARRKEDPTPALLYNLGLAALKEGKQDAAESAFRRARAAAERDQKIASPAGLGLGASFWEQGMAEEKKGPQGLEQAIALTRKAREAWVRTLMDDNQCDPARRNIERANQRLAALEKKKKKQDQQKKKDKDKQDKEKKQDEDKKKQEKKQEKKQDDKQQQDKKKKKKKKKKGEKKKPGDKKKKKSQTQKKKKKSSGKKVKKRLSPEQMKKLEDKLKEMEKERRALKKSLVPARPRGGRNW